ncbi:unnamed protein product [Boreogadus saida]
MSRPRSAEERRGVAACGRVLCGLGRCKPPGLGRCKPPGLGRCKPPGLGRCKPPGRWVCRAGGCRGRVPAESQSRFIASGPQRTEIKPAASGACKPDVCTDSVALVQCRDTHHADVVVVPRGSKSRSLTSEAIALHNVSTQPQGAALLVWTNHKGAATFSSLCCCLLDDCVTQQESCGELTQTCCFKDMEES